MTKNMTLPWRLELYDARFVLVGAVDPDTKLPSGSLEIIVGQHGGHVPTFDECRDIALLIVSSVNELAKITASS